MLLKIFHKNILNAAIFSVVLIFCSSLAYSQVYVSGDGSPWNRTLKDELDQNVPGWFINLGITGIRVDLHPNRLDAMLVQHIMPGSVAQGRIQKGDWIVGAGGRDFVENADLGKFTKLGGRGPVGEFAIALEACQSSSGNGILNLVVERNRRRVPVSLSVGKVYGSYSPTYPFNCPKSDKLTTELVNYIRNELDENGNWGGIIVGAELDLQCFR